MEVKYSITVRNNWEKGGFNVFSYCQRKDNSRREGEIIETEISEAELLTRLHPYKARFTFVDHVKRMGRLTHIFED